MNKNLLIRNGIVFFSLAISNQLYSQVGINTNKPVATLDVVSHPTANVLDGIIAPRITASDLKNKIYSLEQTGAFLYVTEGFGSVTPSTQTALIKTTGYYVFDGSQWKPFGTDNTNVGWGLGGNSETTSSNFIGTTDINPLKFKVNSINAGLIEYSANGFGSTSFGQNSLINPNPNINSVAFGSNVLTKLTSGYYNSAFGNRILEQLTTGTMNVSIGGLSGYNLVDGNNNAFLGANAGTGIVNGNNNTHIGYTNRASGNNISNTVILGNNNSAFAGSNNSILIGNNSTSAGLNNIILGSSSASGNINGFIRSNIITIGNNISPINSTLSNNRIIANNELIIHNYASSSDDSIPLIRGNFTTASKYLKIGGKFILEPTLTEDATGDLAYTKMLLAKEDGSVGFSNFSYTPVVTVNSTSISRVRLGNDITSSTISRTTIPNWNFNVSNGKVYKVKIFGAYSTIATTTGGSLGFILTNGATGTIFGKIQMNIVHTNSAAPEQVITAIDNSSTTVRSFATSTGVGTINIPEVIDGEVIFECTADGTFNLQWGSEVASSTATLLKNSIIEIIEI